MCSKVVVCLLENKLWLTNNNGVVICAKCTRLYDIENTYLQLNEYPTLVTLGSSGFVCDFFSNLYATTEFFRL
jgi:hypothetical protein